MKESGLLFEKLPIITRLCINTRRIKPKGGPRLITIRSKFLATCKASLNLYWVVVVSCRNGYFSFCYVFVINPLISASLKFEHNIATRFEMDNNHFYVCLTGYLGVVNSICYDFLTI